MHAADDGRKHQRRSIRLRGYDYTQAGAYFVTVCSVDRASVFGEIVNDAMRLNEWGEIVQVCWADVPHHYECVELDTFTVMPNHVHGIMTIHIVGAGLPRPGLSNDVAAGGETPPLRPTLGQIVAYFKYKTTKRINLKRYTPAQAVWQRNYYERVIRNERELNAVRQYITDNPARWAKDRENPQNRKTR